MSLEKPPVPGEPKVPTPEELKKSIEKEPKKTEESLSSENQAAYAAMPAEAQSIFSKMYEGLYKIPVVNKIVGKIEIAYNQSFMEEHEGKAAALKDKMKGFDARMRALEETKKETEAAAEEMERDGLPGAAQMKVRAKQFEKEAADLMTKRDKVQTKFESAENKMKLRANKRDAIADRLIGFYEARLEPMERKLEELRTEEDEVDLLVEVAGVKHAQQGEKIEELKKKVESQVKALRASGMTEYKAEHYPSVTMLEEHSANIKKMIEEDSRQLQKRKAVISEKVADAEEKANPYRDNREEFVKVKAGRPSVFGVATRTKEMPYREQEAITPRTRHEAKVKKPEEKAAAPEIKKESAEGGKEKIDISEMVERWNTHYQEKFGNEAANDGIIVDLNEFLKATRLKKDFVSSNDGFRKILGKYFKLKKMPQETFEKYFGKK